MDENTTPQKPAPVSPTPITHPSGISESERQWGMFAHLSSFLVFIGIPFANVIGPFIMWQMKKDSMPFGSNQAKEALNFQITMVIAGFIGFLLVWVGIGFVLLMALFVFNLVVIIMAAIKANEGIAYRYPLCIRLVN